MSLSRIAWTTKGTPMELFETVMKLVGPVEPTASHGTDLDRLENLKTLTELTDRILFVVSRVAKSADSQADSVQRLGVHARDFLISVKYAGL
jgi:hypothetical protein